MRYLHQGLVNISMKNKDSSLEMFATIFWQHLFLLLNSHVIWEKYIFVLIDLLISVFIIKIRSPIDCLKYFRNDLLAKSKK